jgi:hypothetical protein
MTALLPSACEHLAKLLGLLGSDHAGERDNAGRAAHRLVQEHGLTWFDIVAPTPGEAAHGDGPIGVDWRRTAVACLRYPHLLNRLETDLLAGLPRFQRLSCKQRAALLKIVVRLRACGCAL